MILKKPYAFLIKHFRIIHLLLLLPIAYLINRTYRIVSFFRVYVQNNYTTNIVNISASHISFFMYLAVLLILLAVLAIYYLMRQKKKSTKLYFFILVYYILLFVLIGVTHSILSGMEHDLITAQAARAYRDVSFMICLPQYFFFIYVLIRGIGFDIKKFDFAGDLKDLEITDIDNEEFEFALNVEGYKAKRTFRRFLRETKYYVLENKFIFSCLLAIVIIGIGTTLYLHYGVYNRTYHVSDKMRHNALNIQITDSMVTNLGMDGNVITKGKYYLALQLLVENRTNVDVEELDYNNFRLVLNGKNIYPTLDRGPFFADLGIPYQREKIKRQTKEYYVLVYEIPENDLASEYTIKILESVDYKVGEIAAKYKNIVLNPVKIDSITENSLTTEQIANLRNSTLGLTTFRVNNYSFQNSYTYDYEYCSNNGCRTLKDRITPDVSGTIEKTTLFVLGMEYNIDPNSIYASVIRTDEHFFNQFFSLRYQIEGVEKVVSLNNRTTKYMKDMLVFETREEASRAEKLDLLLTVRNHRYVFHLK